MKVAVVDYPAGNIRSVFYALERLGAEGQLTAKPEEILSADRVIFPGVGEASTTMASLNETGLSEVIKQVKAPFLGICLGLQLMCESSEEAETKGLGILPAKVKRFNGELKVPQMGWNKLEDLKGPLFEGLAEDKFVYFVHSYFAEVVEQTVASAQYGERFSAALSKDNFYAMQFHPEKSADVGAQILKLSLIHI